MALPARSRMFGPTMTLYWPSVVWKPKPISNFVLESGVTDSASIAPLGPVMETWVVVKLDAWIALLNVTSMKESPVVMVPLGDEETTDGPVWSMTTDAV